MCMSPGVQFKVDLRGSRLVEGSEFSELRLLGLDVCNFILLHKIYVSKFMDVGHDNYILGI